MDVADRAAFGRLQASDRFQKLFLAVAGDAGDAEDLSAVRRKGYIVQLHQAFFIAHRQVVHTDPRAGIHRLRPLDGQRYRMADQQVGHFLRVGILREHIAHVGAFTKHGHTVRQLLYLVHLMGDDHDGLAVVAHVAQDPEQFFRFLRGQDGGGLVQDQNVGPAVEHFDDLHRLFLGHGHVVDLLVGIQIETVLPAKVVDALRHLLDVEASLFLQPQSHVFRRGQHVDQFKVLVDHADPVLERILGGSNDHFLAVDVDLAGIREIDTCQHVHQCGFSTAVLAQDRQDLSGVNIQLRILVGDHRSEDFGDASHFDDRFFVFHVAPHRSHVCKPERPQYCHRAEVL